VFAWLWVGNRRQYRQENENMEAKLGVEEMEQRPETKHAQG
jgi:hypothetical protein